MQKGPQCYANAGPVFCVVLLSPTAVAQEVTFAELQGTVIETTVVLQQVVRREGKEFENRVQQDFVSRISPSAD